MPRLPILFLALFALGLAASATFHSTGALSAKDALVAAAAQGSSVLDPPLRWTARFTGIVIDAGRSMRPTSELFSLVHHASGILLALAAAASGVAASIAAGVRPGAAITAALAVGAGVLFGRTTGFGGIAGSSVAMTLAFLSGTALFWNLQRPRAFAGGLLLGLAIAEHPFTLFTLPGFLAMSIGMDLRDVEAGGRSFRRAGAGFAVGLLALVFVRSRPNGDALLAFAAPGQWLPHVVELVRTFWNAGGPIGFFAAIVGLRALHGGATPRARPFLAIHAFPAIAFVFLSTKDPEVLLALSSWSFLFFLVPAIDASARFAAGRWPSPRDSVILVVAAALSCGALFAWNARHLDHRAERGLGWARASFDRLTQDGILLTANPVHWALFADGERPDLDVLLVGAPATIEMRRSSLGLFAPAGTDARTMTPDFLREVIAMNFSRRPIFMDPSLFFDPPVRTAIFGDDWRGSPFGTAVRVEPRGQKLDAVVAKAADVLWDELDITPGTPPSPLRDGLTGNEFFARSLLQSAALYLESGMQEDAEREFLFALTLDAANPNVAAYGLARVYFERERYEEAVLTLERYYDAQREGAWVSQKLLGIGYLRLGDTARAQRALEEALRLCPANLTEERRAIGPLLEGARAGRRLPGRTPGVARTGEG